MSLPDEAASREIVAKQFADLFARAERAHNALVEVITRGKIAPKKPIGRNLALVVVVTGIVAKVCKTFRAIMLVCEYGLGPDAAVLARQLFETSVAIDFILSKDEDAIKRAAMYAAYQDQRNLVLIDEASRVSGLERTGSPENLAMARQKVDQWLQYLDADTLESVKGHWSGHGIKWAAEQVNLQTAYTMMYRYTSMFAHGADATGHFFLVPGQDGFTLRLQPGDELIEPVLKSSISLLQVVAEAVNNGLGLDEAPVVERIKAETAPLSNGEEA